jgi:hypothetical protein
VPVKNDAPQEDPVYRHSLREGILILAIWGLCLVYTCTYCYLFGYLSHEPHPSPVGPSLGEWLGPLTAFDRDPATLTTPLGLGIPDWIFYGVVLPWLLCIGVTFWFCLFYFVEDDLGDDALTTDDPGAGGES